MRMKRLRAWLSAPIGVIATGWLLLGMVALAMHVAGAFGSGLFGPGAGLDYSSAPLGRCFPLRAPFVDTVLGGLGPGDAGFRSPASDDPRTNAGSVTHGLSNDAEAQAYLIESVPFTARSDTSHATRERSDPTECTRLGSTVWYRFVAVQDATLVASTAASYPVSLGVFAAPADRSSHALGCDSNRTGLARVAFPAFAGHTYLFQITGVVRGGPLAFSL